MDVPINPGSVMEVYWRNPGGENWPQIQVHLWFKSVHENTCDKLKGTTTKWFKIDHQQEVRRDYLATSRTHLRFEHILTRSAIHYFLWWTPVEPRPARGIGGADMTGQLSGNGSSSSPGGNSCPSSTNGADSGAQPTGVTQSSFSQVCKLQKRDATLSRRDTGIAQHKRHMSFMRAIRDAFYHS
ncbi:hypothetical protein V8E52_003026 [Russula decolorans]